MSKTIELRPGEPIPRIDGTLSAFVYLKEAPDSGRLRRVMAKCTCGQTTSRALHTIRTGASTKCLACARKPYRKDKTGKRFGRLVVLKRLPGHERWLCRCECGTETIVLGCSLIKKTGTKSCGCLQRERAGKSAAMRGSNYAKGMTIGPFTILNKVESRRYQQRYRVLDSRDNKTKILAQPEILRQANPFTRLKDLCHRRINHAYRRKGITKTRSFTKFFNYSEAELQNHLGPHPGRGYHIDHICPLDAATTEDEILKLFALENLQWLIGPENSSKSNNWTKEGARLHKKLLGRPWPKPKQ